VAALRATGVPMALATDCNPGTSPTTSPTLMMNMACTLFGLTVAEALAGFTRAGARALGFDDRGVLDVGLRADIALWAVGSPAELAYRVGSTRCAGVVRGGVLARGPLRDAAV
jgi:imidazolonepropionase